MKLRSELARSYGNSLDDESIRSHRSATDTQLAEHPLLLCSCRSSFPCTPLSHLNCFPCHRYFDGYCEEAGVLLPIRAKWVKKHQRVVSKFDHYCYCLGQPLAIPVPLSDCRTEFSGPPQLHPASRLVPPTVVRLMCSGAAPPHFRQFRRRAESRRILAAAGPAADLDLDRKRFGRSRIRSHTAADCCRWAERVGHPLYSEHLHKPAQSSLGRLSSMITYFL